MEQPLGQLKEPPIVEVVCGISFRPIASLDPLSLGAFWKDRRAEYPRREFKAPIVPPGPLGLEIDLGPDRGPLRTWLISKDDVFILQVQHDRFYLNWRARQDDYPRFSDREGRKGLLSLFLSQQEAFERFCEHELGTKLDIQGIELAKIDHLERDRHWKDARDLGVLMPMLSAALEFAEKDPVVALRLSTPRDNGAVDIAIDTLFKVSKPNIPVVKLECRRSVRQALPSSGLEHAFKLANRELNDLFRALIPESQHHRFEEGWKP